MSRLRALAYGASVAVGVFVYLALPTLRELFGPVANLAVYALLALLAGGVTYGLVYRMYDRTEAGARHATDPVGRLDRSTGGGTAKSDDATSADIDRELETIKDDR